MEKYAITHPEQGIYVGNALGMAFWSKWDAGGQTRAVVFDSETDARDHVASWMNGNADGDYGYAPVEVSADAEFATVDELIEAGLGDLIGELAITNPVCGHA